MRERSYSQQREMEISTLISSRSVRYLTAIRKKAKAEYRTCTLTVGDIRALTGVPCACGKPAYLVRLKTTTGEYTRENVVGICSECAS